MDQQDAITETQVAVDDLSKRAVAIIKQMSQQAERELAEKDAFIQQLAQVLGRAIILPADYGNQIDQALKDNNTEARKTAGIVKLVKSWRPEVPKSLVDGE